MSAADDHEGLPALRDALARATDDGVRAGLHDAIAIQLSRGGRVEEALAENARAVLLRNTLAQCDPGVLPVLAVSLANQGVHLAALRRYEDAIVSHLRALEIVTQFDPTAPQSLARLAYNASRLGHLLLQLVQPYFAARFDGVALAACLVLAEKDSYRAVVANQLSALCLSLDRAAGPALALPVTLDRSRLLAAAAPSLRTASYLSQWSEAMSHEGDLTLATVLARRTVTYCDLFDEVGGSQSLSSLRSENTRRLADGFVASSQGVPTSAPIEQDRRLWSISGRELTGLVGELVQRGFPSSDVYALGSRFAEEGLYPARDCAYRCHPRPPQVFITYTWSDNYVDLQVAVRSALHYLGGLIRLARPELDSDVVDRLVNEKLGVWIDFVFIDQSSRRLVEEVRDVLPRAIKAADVHFVLSDTAMLRSWCCYEVALFTLFNHGDAAEAPWQGSLQSFVGRSVALNYQTFALTQVSQPADKHTIEREIVDHYPGGMSAFDALMMQASLLSDSFVSRGFAQSQSAIDLVSQSVDRWLAP
ncbi:MAG: hypothetical protein MUF16_09255 [Burkholderiaceae bacterium]|nr:hypothetical protein [Burkholderiaceae bacterium]